MGISTDTALRLAKYFDTTPNAWLNLQQSYDLAVGAEQIKHDLATIHPRDAGNDNDAAARLRSGAGSGSGS